MWATYITCGIYSQEHNSQCSSILDNVHLNKLSHFTKWTNETNSALKKNKNSQSTTDVLQVELSYWYFRNIAAFIFGLKQYYLFIFECSCNGNTVLLYSALQSLFPESWQSYRGVNNATPFLSLSSKFTIMCFIITDGGWWAFCQWIQSKHFQKWFLEAKLHEITQGKGNFHILVIYIVNFSKSVILCQNFNFKGASN